MPTADTTPDPRDLWSGIAGHFDSFSQVLCEFVDNSVSNFQAETPALRDICIVITELDTRTVRVTVEDTGSGIKDLAIALKLGDKSRSQTPLNEHGFGLKHALASADPENANWAIYTRTEAELSDGTYRSVSAPYSFAMEIVEHASASSPWPGRFNTTGTLIRFTCSKHLFNTVQSGVQGQAGFKRCLEYLLEHLGYTYAGIIEKNVAVIRVECPDPANPFNQPVPAVTPNWAGFYEPKKGSVDHDLGKGVVRINYVFGEMDKSEHTFYYKRNMATSGVELRINGRVILNKLFTEIWPIESHPSYNHFLAILDLVTSDLECLPPTRTSKNGLRWGDDRLEELFAWVRKTHPSPPKELSDKVSERDLVKQLKELKEKNIRALDKRIEVEFPVFLTLGSSVAVDMYLYDGKDVVLYEAKKKTADVQDLYQLLMYWDGAVADNISPTEGILLASDFSDAVSAVMRRLNAVTDADGNLYRFVTKRWTDEGIPFPKP